jgi:hypothetical protein
MTTQDDVQEQGQVAEADASPPPDEALAGDAAGQAAAGQVPATGGGAAEQAEGAFDERPEIFVAGAFLGGFVIAKLLGALGGGND